MNCPIRKTLSSGLWMLLMLHTLAFAESSTPTEERLCGKRAPCHLAKTDHIPGSSKAKISRYLNYVVLGEQGAPWGQVPSFGQSDQCVEYEVWLTEVGETGQIQDQMIASLCNDGYGARGVGLDQFKIMPNRIEYVQSGGSNWQWSRSRVLDVERQTIEHSAHSLWSGGGRAQERTQWTWGTSPTGVSQWFMDRCGEGATVLPYEKVPPLTDEDFFQYRNIPWFEFSQLAETDRWQQTDISSCALTLDSAGGNGYIIHGKVGKPSDAILRLIAVAPQTLLIDVIDDKFVQSTKSWVAGDHLEVWVGERISLVGWCIKEEPLPIRQWGVRVSDGKVFPAKGKPVETLKVEMAKRGENHVRLKIELPDEVEALTLVYSDSDDGHTQERLIATSKFTFGRTETLGRPAEKISPEFGRCTHKDNRLIYEQPKWHGSPSIPVIPRE